MTKPQPFTSRSPLAFSGHFRAQMRTKGFDARDVHAALTDPYKITEVRRYPGQWRFCGSGVAVVVAFDSDVPRAVTLYVDGEVTPLRPDQMNDPAALASQRLNR